MQKKVLFIIAQNGFQQIEYRTPKKILENAGVGMVTASLDVGAAIGKDGSEAKVDLSVGDVQVEDYDGIYIIGGPGAIHDLDNDTVHAIMREAEQQGKMFGAICISVRILAKAGTLVDRKATGHNDDGLLPNILEDNIATFIDQPVVHDDNVITATGPSAAEEFGKTIVKALA